MLPSEECSRRVFKLARSRTVEAKGLQSASFRAFERPRALRRRRSERACALLGGSERLERPARRAEAYARGARRRATPFAPMNGSGLAGRLNRVAELRCPRVAQGTPTRDRSVGPPAITARSSTGTPTRTTLRNRDGDPGPRPPRPRDELRAARDRVPDAAYERNPERFLRRPPVPPELPTGAWTNKPDAKDIAH